MSTYWKFFLSTTLFFLLFSCEEENRESNSREYLSMGVYETMEVISYDTLLAGGYNEMVSMDLDVNHDNIYDFQISSKIWGSPGLGMHPLTVIKSLDPGSMLSVRTFDDTIYVRYSIYIYYGENGVPVSIYNSTSYFCGIPESTDSIFSIEPDQIAINYYSKGESISNSDEFRSVEIELSDDQSAYTEGPVSNIDGDTLRYWSVFSYTSCNSVPNDQVVYFGTKIQNNGETKLGWIKLVLIREAEVLVLETAIQE